MRNKIWSELVDIKYGETYLTIYIKLQQALKMRINILTLIFSFSGIFRWQYFEAYVKIVFIIIIILQLLQLIGNQIIYSDKKIQELSNLKMMYTRCFNKLDELWTSLQVGEIDDSGAKKKYFDLRTTDWENIVKLDGELNIKQYKKMMNRTEIKNNDYLNRYKK